MELTISQRKYFFQIIISLFIAVNLFFSSCDFSNSLLAPGDRLIVLEDPPEILIDEFGALYAERQFTIAINPETSHSEIREFARSLGDEIHGFNDVLSWVYVRSDRPVNEVEFDWQIPDWSQIAVRDYVVTAVGFDNNDNSNESSSTYGKRFTEDEVLTFDDPLLNDQWGVHKIRAPEVWVNFGRGEGVNVGIIDGPWYDPPLENPDPTKDVPTFLRRHKDLDGAWREVTTLVSDAALVAQWHLHCSKDEPYKSCWVRSVSHATHVGGIIGARSNDFGIVGIAPESQLWPLHEFWWLDTKRFWDSIYALVNKGVDVINISMRSLIGENHPKRSEMIELWKQALRYAHTNGVLVINAAANDDDNAEKDMFILTVGTRPNGIVVGASSRDILGRESRASFSNWGFIVEIYAPGTSILSTIPCLSDNPCSDSKPFNGYDRKNGTSMAAPHVTGTAALIYSIGKERFGERPSPEQVKRSIIEGSMIGGVTIDNRVNRVPRLDAYEAVLYYLREACTIASGSVAKEAADLCPVE